MRANNTVLAYQRLLLGDGRAVPTPTTRETQTWDIDGQAMEMVVESGNGGWSAMPTATAAAIDRFREEMRTIAPEAFREGFRSTIGAQVFRGGSPAGDDNRAQRRAKGRR